MFIAYVKACVIHAETIQKDKRNLWGEQDAAYAKCIYCSHNSTQASKLRLSTCPEAFVFCEDCVLRQLKPIKRHLSSNLRRYVMQCLSDVFVARTGNAIPSPISECIYQHLIRDIKATRLDK